MPAATPGVGARTPWMPAATPGVGARTPWMPAVTPGVGARTPWMPAATPGVGARTPWMPAVTPGVGARTPWMPAVTPGVGARTPWMPAATPQGRPRRRPSVRAGFAPREPASAPAPAPSVSIVRESRYGRRLRSRSYPHEGADEARRCWQLSVAAWPDLDRASQSPRASNASSAPHRACRRARTQAQAQTRAQAQAQARRRWNAKRLRGRPLPGVHDGKLTEAERAGLHFFTSRANSRRTTRVACSAFPACRRARACKPRAAATRRCCAACGRLQG
jgi:hypothetical protein